jgi:hypothetical protein
VEQRSRDPGGEAISPGVRESWAGAGEQVKALKQGAPRRGKLLAARVGRLLSPPANRSDGRDYSRDTGRFSDQRLGVSSAQH